MLQCEIAGRASWTQPIHDIFVIGGGINGCGIARDAAGRGFSVFLAEMNDLASGTSSGSTKLIHGGLRYLEYYEFRLVREALMEREVLWSIAPHIIWPLRFVLPYHKGLRPAWLLRLGLFLYDHLGGRKLLPATRTLDMRSDPAGKPLKPLFTKAFEYSDCWVNDARLVVLNARDAADRGATIRTRTKVTSARGAKAVCGRSASKICARARPRTVKARLLVNAAGPWVDHVLSERCRPERRAQCAAGPGQPHRRAARSSTIRAPISSRTRTGASSSPSPMRSDFTLIGTTDRDYHGDPADVQISDAEIDYLCAAASEYFAEPVTPRRHRLDLFGGAPAL